MQANTHAAVGIAIGTVASMTQSKEMMLLVATSAFMGSIICDIDVGDTGKKHTPVLLTAVSSMAAILLGIYAYFFGTEIAMLWQSESGYLRSVIGIIAFIGICILGSKKPHRSFLHSILGMLLLVACVFLFFPTASVYFLLGYVSHLGLDLLNYRPLMLFYPMKKGYSLKLCYSKSRASTVMLCVACAVIAGVVVLF
jgi:inner membrane protein